MSINDMNNNEINNEFESLNDLNFFNPNNSVNIINSINNLSINDSNNFGQNIDEKDKIVNNNSSNSNLVSSKSTEFSSIRIDLENSNNKIYSYIYSDIKENKIRNSIIILNEKEQIKNIYLTIINNFYINNNINNKSFNKICFLILDLKKLEKLSEELKLIYKDKNISILKGGKGKKMKSDYDIFINYFEKGDIFIAIPDVFYKLLSTGFIKIYQFSILFFDDCHLCEGNHPYNNIMQEFYFYYLYRQYILKINNKYSLPYIIGFSNSPLLLEKINNKDDKSNKILINLCENLDCQIIKSSQSSFKNESINSNENEENIEYIQINNILCKEKIDIIYKILNHYFIEKTLNLSFNDYISQNSKIILTDEDKRDIYNKYLEIIKQKLYTKDKEEYIKIEALQKKIKLSLKSSYIFSIFEDMLKYLLFIFQNFDIEDIINIFQKYLILFQNFLISQKMNQDTKITEKINYFIGIINDCIGAFQYLNNNFEYQNETNIKFLSLIKSIYIYNNNKNAKIIIIVRSRKLAFLLNELLIRKNYKSEYLTGINTFKGDLFHLSLITKTTYNIINEINKKYNSDDINILICTPSICDNLQINKCDYIIIFKELTNLNYDYIKIRKIAINKNAKLIIFSTDINIDNIKNLYKEETKKFENISPFVENKIDFRRNIYLKEKFKIIEKSNYYFIEETQAKVSIKNSIILFNDINNYFISQNKKVIVNKFMDEYFVDKIKKFKYKIQLDKKFGTINIFSHSYGDKQSAEGDCYLQLIGFLHKYGIIDNNLKMIESK